MKTVKLKSCDSITIANQEAPISRTPSGAIVFEITNVLDNVTLAQVCQKYTSFCGMYYGGHSFKWSLSND